jgi:hypothetical protein
MYEAESLKRTWDPTMMMVSVYLGVNGLALLMQIK